MINLMPYDMKKQTIAARINVMLFKYVVILGFSAVFLVLACSVTYLFLISIKANAENQIKINTTSSPIQKQANIFRTNLSVAQSILGQQVNYSDIVMEIGEIMPEGMVLDSLKLDDSTFGTNLVLKVLSTSADNETKLKHNIEGSTLFSNYKFQSTNSSTKDDATKYSFIIEVSVTVNRKVTL